MEIKKLRSDADVKALAKDFFVKAQGAVSDDPSRIPFAGGFRTIEDLLFVIDKSVRQAEVDLVTRCTKLLGSKFGHEKEIRDTAWNVAKAAIDSHASPDKFVSEFLQALGSGAEEPFWHIRPNYLIRFETSSTRLSIGPVEALLGSDAISQIPTHKLLELRSGDDFTDSIANGKIIVELSPVIWKVEITCAHGHVIEEAAWKIDMAISLLRLHYQHPSGFFPQIGDIEGNPFAAFDGATPHLTGKHTLGLSTGGLSIHGMYTINDDIRNITLSPSFIERAKAVFSPNAKHLSARLGEGLGWLTRGRRSEDRAQRFLFFFTAIEALLSSDDKAAPISQTIARQASAILIDDPQERADFARRLLTLYETRSALVHAGTRNVSQSDANKLQYIAEALYTVVMQRTKLDVPFREFQTSLGLATYGSKWPPSSTPPPI